MKIWAWKKFCLKNGKNIATYTRVWTTYIKVWTEVNRINRKLKFWKITFKKMKFWEVGGEVEYIFITWKTLTVCPLLEALRRNVLRGAYDLSVVEHAWPWQVLVYIACQTHQSHPTQSKVCELDVALTRNQQTKQTKLTKQGWKINNLKKVEFLKQFVIGFSLIKQPNLRKLDQ